VDYSAGRTKGDILEFVNGKVGDAPENFEGVDFSKFKVVTNTYPTSFIIRNQLNFRNNLKVLFQYFDGFLGQAATENTT
jgi:hypothetical protein